MVMLTNEIRIFDFQHVIFSEGDTLAVQLLHCFFTHASSTYTPLQSLTMSCNSTVLGTCAMATHIQTKKNRKKNKNNKKQKEKKDKNQQGK